MSRCAKDYTNQVCGCWKVIERDFNPQSKSHSTFWKCECQNCGNIASVRKEDLDRKPSSCNNCKGDYSSLASRKKYHINPGDTFGFLTILERPHTAHLIEKREGVQLANLSGKHSYVKCQCKCGNVIYVRSSHLLGLNRHSRTISCGCASRSSGEIKIESILQENQIEYKIEHRISEFNYLSPFDFAIFKNGQFIGVIEYDGAQHTQKVDHFGGEEEFQRRQRNDQAKNDWCKKNNIPLLRIDYTQYDDINIDMIKDFFDLS